MRTRSVIYRYVNALAACASALPAKKIPARRHAKSFKMLEDIRGLWESALDAYSLGYLPVCKRPRCVRIRLAGEKNPGAQAR